MKVYIHPNCSSCKKALKWLESHALKGEVISLLEKTPTMEEFQQMLNGYGGELKKLFNTSGARYRELELKDRLSSLTTQEAFSLLLEEGMLVKRPFLITEHAALIGFKENQWGEALL